MRTLLFVTVALLTLNCTNPKDGDGPDWHTDSGQNDLSEPSDDADAGDGDDAGGGETDDGGTDAGGTDSDDTGDTSSDTGDGTTDTGSTDDDGDGFSTATGDCDDTSSATYPGASEVCDGIDNDCDEEIDEDAVDAIEWYRDADGDGLGDPDVTTRSCGPVDGWVVDMSDCDDTDATTDGCVRCMSGRMDGSLSQIQVDDHIDWAFGTADFSLGIWLRFKSMEGSHQPLIAQKQHDVFETWALYLNSGLLLFGRRLEGATPLWNEVSTPWTPTMDAWHFVVVTREHETITFFVDGEAIGATTQFMAIPNFNGKLEIATAMLVGGELNRSHIDVDAMHVWGKALSPAEVFAYTIAHPTGEEDDLKAFWNYSEGSGTSSVDLSGNGHSASFYMTDWLAECSLL